MNVGSPKLAKVKQAWDTDRFPLPGVGRFGEQLCTLQGATAPVDDLDRIKFRLKRFPNLYSWIVRIVGPVCPTFNMKRELKKMNLADMLFLNVGSENVRLHPEVVNTDVIAFPNVDIVADAGNLPFRDSTIDGICCLAVLEHVPDPQEVVADMLRVLKPGALMYCEIPFMQGFHASPHDYTRYTISGMRHLFKDYEIISLESDGGPTSALLWIFQEWLAILLSFGSRRVHRFLFLVLTVTLWPVKFLDFLLVHYPTSSNISSLFKIVVRKPINA